MAEDSGISWTDHTFNPWIGCTKVSPACANCYAERDMDHRFGRVKWGPNGTRSLTSDENWIKPHKWNRLAGQRGTSLTFGEAISVYGKELPECEGHEWDNRTTAENNQWLIDNGVDPFRRPRVFCASLADVFEEWEGPIHNHHGEHLYTINGAEWFTEQEYTDCRSLTMDDVRRHLFELIDATPNLDWLLLTKRPENILRMWRGKKTEPSESWCNENLDNAGRNRWFYRDNVWLGTTVENQEYADKRILLECRDLAPVLFLSCEPMLGPIDLSAWLPIESDRDCSWRLRSKFGPEHSLIDWVIAGGESGPEARPSHPEWFESLRDQCKAAGVPFHFKQWGEYVPGDHDCVTFGDDMKEILPWHSQKFGNDITPMVRVGVKRSGRLLDGVLHDAFPK